MLEGKELCPCFDYAEDDIPPDETGETPAERGTRLHLATQNEDLSITRDESELDLVQSCIAFSKAILNLYPEKAEILKEVRVDLPPYTGGVADFVAVWRKLKRAYIIDYKYIRTDSVTHPKDNLQLACYAAAFMSSYPDIDIVDVTIFAPDIGFAPDPRTYTRSELPDVIARIEKVILEVSDPFKQPRAGPKCAKCAHAGRCPALGHLAVAVGKNIGLPLPEEFKPESLATPGDRSFAQALAVALENWSADVKSYNLAAAKLGVEIPNYTLRSRKGSLKITSTQAAAELLQRAQACSTEELLSNARLSLSGIAEVYELRHGVSAADARRTVESILTDILERSPNSVFLQRQTNPKKGNTNDATPLMLDVGMPDDN